MANPMFYQQTTRMSKNSLVTDPRIPDPENLPEPLGWNILVRPLPILPRTRGGIILADSTVDYMSNSMNIAKVIKVGPCCWNRTSHKDIDGNRFDWVKEGDFISYPRHVGTGRKFKGVYYVLLGDDEIVERLPDPQVFDDDMYVLDLGEDDTYKSNYDEKGNVK